MNYLITNVVLNSDYLPFGVELEGRKGTANERGKHGFQGQLLDDDIKGEGNSVNYKYRMHDPRIGRFFAVDPLAPKYAYNSPYAFSENRVIDRIELEGLETAELDNIRRKETLYKSTTYDDISITLSYVQDNNNYLLVSELNLLTPKTWNPEWERSQPLNPCDIGVWVRDDNFERAENESKENGGYTVGAYAPKQRKIYIPEKDQYPQNEKYKRYVSGGSQTKMPSSPEELRANFLGLPPSPGFDVNGQLEKFNGIEIYISPELRQTFKDEWTKNNMSANYNGITADDLIFLDKPTVKTVINTDGTQGVYNETTNDNPGMTIDLIETEN